MAIPMLKSAVACADFSRTVQPYISQLNDLPQQVLQSATSLQALKELYLNTNPLISAFAFSLFLAPIFLVVSEINKNYSQVDRVWSLLPTVYNLHYAVYGHARGLPTQRLNSLTIISAIWSVRSWNHLRHVRMLTHPGTIDIQLLAQRWLHSRFGGLSMGNPTKTHKSTSILYLQRHIYFFSTKCTHTPKSFAPVLQLNRPQVLLFTITTPTYLLLLTSSIVKPDMTDMVFGQFMLIAVFLAFIADQQQWGTLPPFPTNSIA